MLENMEITKVANGYICYHTSDRHGRTNNLDKYVFNDILLLLEHIKEYTNKKEE